MFTQSNLSTSLSKIGVIDSSDIFFELEKAYGGAGRHYHDQSHISECLSHLSASQELALRPSEVEIAIWFHDAIYDTTRSDNEERSADWAASYLRSQGVVGDVITRIHAMILATKTHNPLTDDEILLVDIDLGILGTPPDIFEQYDEAIRREYHWVPKEQYVAGRIDVLQSFLDRPAIFSTERFALEHEAAARKNLERKISQLAKS